MATTPRGVRSGDMDSACHSCAAGLSLAVQVSVHSGSVPTGRCRDTFTAGGDRQERQSTGVLVSLPISRDPSRHSLEEGRLAGSGRVTYKNVSVVVLSCHTAVDTR